MDKSETNQAVINTLKQKLLADYAPLKVILFGSYAHGRPDPDSDIDLLIIKETNQGFIDRWVEVQGLLTGLHRHLPVETLVLTPSELDERIQIGDQFIMDIIERCKVLYATCGVKLSGDNENL